MTGPIDPHRRDIVEPHSKEDGAVAGVVLGAGSSTRMGRNKLLLELGGESLLRRVVNRAVAADLEPVIVVLGFEADRALRALAGLPFQAVLNEHYQHGLNASLRAGLRAVPPTSAAALVMLADMPHVTTDMLDGLVRRYRTTDARLVISNYEGVDAPPVLYDRSLFAELEAVRGSDGGKGVIQRHRSEAVTVSWPAVALSDLDVPEDYDRARARLS
jgi:molybdenum cofactor cytidylyltransferase